MEDSNEPAAKADIRQLRTVIDHQYKDLVERISDSETKLLQAFYTYAESNQKRMAAIEMDYAALKSRLSTIEDRLIGVEKRMNLPHEQ